MNPSSVVFQSARAYGDIYGLKSNVQRSIKYRFWQRNEAAMNTLSVTDLALHHKKRRVLNLAFSEKSIRAAEVFIQKHVDRWDELLTDGDSKDWSQPKNMTHWTGYLVFDILCDLCFGRPLNIKEPGKTKFKGIPKLIESYMKFNYPVRINKAMKWPLLLMS